MFSTVGIGSVKKMWYVYLLYYLNSGHVVLSFLRFPLFEICILQKLGPLKLRCHGAAWNGKFSMPFDERYTPYIKSLGLLPFISLVSRWTPNLNAAGLTALVDRWRPETHNFHLRTGEMTVTLQDVSMILGLPIEGEPLCINTDSDGWRAQMEDLIGRAPVEDPDPKKNTVPAGAPYKWIYDNFRACPEGADEDTVKRYTKVYVWWVITRTLFADSRGRTAQWCWLKALTVLEHKWSWGSAALAYLYRQVIKWTNHVFFVHSH